MVHWFSFEKKSKKLCLINFKTFVFKFWWSFIYYVPADLLDLILLSKICYRNDCYYYYRSHNAFNESHSIIHGSQCCHWLPCQCMWVTMPSSTPMPLYVGHNAFINSHSTVCGSQYLHWLPCHCMWVTMPSLTPMPMWVTMPSLTPMPLYVGHNAFIDSHSTVCGS